MTKEVHHLVLYVVGGGGGKRELEVMNCATQTNSVMLLRDWDEFFNHPDRFDHYIIYDNINFLFVGMTPS